MVATKKNRRDDPAACCYSLRLGGRPLGLDPRRGGFEALARLDLVLARDVFDPSIEATGTSLPQCGHSIFLITIILR